MDIEAVGVWCSPVSVQPKYASSSGENANVVIREAVTGFWHTATRFPLQIAFYRANDPYWTDSGYWTVRGPYFTSDFWGSYFGD